MANLQKYARIYYSFYKVPTFCQKHVRYAKQKTSVNVSSRVSNTGKHGGVLLLFRGVWNP